MSDVWDGALPWLLEEKHAPTAAEVEQLISHFQKHPDSVKIKKKGYFPLHCAVCCYGKEAVTIVQELLDVYPQGAQETIGEGYLPLHLAVTVTLDEHMVRFNKRYRNEEYVESDQDKHRLAIVQALLGVYPEGAQQKSRSGQLPLYFAVMDRKGEHGLAVVEALLAAYPEAAGEMQGTHSQTILLHIAMWLHKGEHAVALIKAMLAAYPEAARKRDRSGALALHVAAEDQCADVVKVLLDVYPEAVRAETEAPTKLSLGGHKETGKLPLHVAVEENTGERGAAVVAALLAAHPEAAQCANSNGGLPLHIAAQCQHGESGLGMVEALLTAWPQAAREKDKSGYLPLHWAARSQKDEHGLAVVTALLASYAQAANEKNEDGCLPLDLAEKYQSNYRMDTPIITLLKQAKNGTWLPEDYTVDCLENLSTLATLLDAAHKST